MKQGLMFLGLFFTTITFCYSQNDIKSAILYDGFYVAKTKSIPDASIDIYTYFRFYSDGSVYLQAVNSNNPQSVASWFGRYKKFSEYGHYEINGANIEMELTSKDSVEFKLKGLKNTIFKGIIKPNNQLCIVRDAETTENCFEFYPVKDTTKFQYATYKPEIKLTGEWEVNQLVESTNQVFFTNADSTVLGISIFKATSLPDYNSSQTDFETAYKYYEWDSKYMKEELQMEIKKITENQKKAFIIWNSKDQNNDNYYLFARHNDLLYNIMIFDEKMPMERQIEYLEKIYDLNVQ